MGVSVASVAECFGSCDVPLLHVSAEGVGGDYRMVRPCYQRAAALVLEIDREIIEENDNAVEKFV